MILLDTNVVSEAMRLRTADALVAAVAGANAFSVASATCSLFVALA
ncbi:MAG: hypothetical protein ACO3AD_17650 [Burkholderiaceae bacterium]